MKKLRIIFGTFLIASLVLTSCSNSNVKEESTNDDIVEDSNNDTNLEELTACDCAKLMKNENPFGKPENEGRDAEEMQKEWEIIWGPCADNEPDFMQEVMKCLNELD